MSSRAELFPKLLNLLYQTYTLRDRPMASLLAFAPAAWALSLLIAQGARNIRRNAACGAIRLQEDDEDEDNEEEQQEDSSRSHPERPLLSVFVTDDDVLEASGSPRSPYDHHGAAGASEADDSRAYAAKTEALLPPTPWPAVLVPLAEMTGWIVATLAYLVANGGPAAAATDSQPWVAVSHVFAWVSLASLFSLRQRTHPLGVARSPESLRHLFFLSLLLLKRKLQRPRAT